MILGRILNKNMYLCKIKRDFIDGIKGSDCRMYRIRFQGDA